MAMASDSKFYPLHFVLFPFMAQGHMIPMIDIAKLLAQHEIKVTVVITPLNGKRFETTLARAVKSGLKIHFIQLQFPAAEAGLPKDCENCDMLPSLGLGREFFSATNMLQEPVEKLLQNLIPRPNCIISNMCLPYTGQVARKLGVPRIAFNGYCCFTMLCMQRIHSSGILENIKSESEYFSVPDLPDHVEINKQQLPQAVLDNMDQFGEQVLEAETMTYGIIINSFEEMESAYVQEYKKVQADKVWCIGPVSLCNKDNLDKAERGDKASIQESECMNFLESQKPGSVIYVCFGSL